MRQDQTKTLNLILNAVKTLSPPPVQGRIQEKENRLLLNYKNNMIVIIIWKIMNYKL